MARVHAIILSAGKGKRMKSDISKQYLLVAGKPILYYTLKAFEESKVDDLVIVTAPEDIAFVKETIVETYQIKKVRDIVCGGKERYDSVMAGLALLPDEEEVLIHDGARPLIKVAHIDRVIDEVQQGVACAVGMPVKDTIKIVDGEEFVKTTPDRRFVWQIQTPQAFRVGLIKNAYDKMKQAGDTGITDDAMAVEKYTGTRIKLIQADYQNVKITTPEDLFYMEAILAHKQFRNL